MNEIVCLDKRKIFSFLSFINSNDISIPVKNPFVQYCTQKFDRNIKEVKKV